MPTQDYCAQCGHPAAWHRHDDTRCLDTHQQPCVPESAQFRCLGWDVDGPGFRPNGCAYNCESYQPPRAASPAQEGP